MTALRCATWRAQIRHSPHTGSQAVVVDVPSETIMSGSIDWDLSREPVASLTLERCGRWDGLRTRMHELWLWRDDDPDDYPSFVGPVLTRAGSASSGLAIGAKGRSWWWTHRRRTATVSGDTTDIARELFVQAEAQGQIGLLFDGRRSGEQSVTEARQIGNCLEEAQVRWAERGTVLQVGPHPFARQSEMLTDTDWDEPPLVLEDGETFATDVLSEPDDLIASTGGVWGRSADLLSSGPPRARWDQISALYQGAGTADGRGPRIVLSSGSTGDDIGVGTLRRGLEVEWPLLRVGASLRVRISTGLGLSIPDNIGEAGAIAEVDVVRLSVDLGSAGNEQGVGISAQSRV